MCVYTAFWGWLFVRVAVPAKIPSYVCNALNPNGFFETAPQPAPCTLNQKRQAMTFDSLDLRRRIVRLAIPGDSFTFAGDFELVKAGALQFSRAKRIPVRIEPSDGGAVITRVDADQAGSVRYPAFGKLQPGESELISVSPQEHQRVRLFASYFGRKTGATFRCTKVDDGIMVTRIDGTAEAQQPARVSKYDLGRLATQREIRFDLERAEHHKLRIACSTKARTTGWAIRCRLQDDGSMLVYRVGDAPAAQAAE